MPKGVKRKSRRKRRRGPKVMVVMRKTKPMSNPLSLLVAMERGQQKRNLAKSPIPKRAIKPHMSIKAEPLLASLLNTSKE
jgi:hypothetical protein